MDNRATIYMNEDDKASIDKLLAILDKQGVKEISSTKGPSMSALFRYLVKKELSDLNATFTKP